MVIKIEMALERKMILTTALKAFGLFRELTETEGGHKQQRTLSSLSFTQTLSAGKPSCVSAAETIRSI